jgi:hypothetical protein
MAEVTLMLIIFFIYLFFKFSNVGELGFAMLGRHFPIELLP